MFGANTAARTSPGSWMKLGRKREQGRRSLTAPAMSREGYPAVSARLADGGIVEMLLKDDRASFILAQGGTLEECERVTLPNGRILIPYSPENNLLTHKVVLLPSKVEKYDSHEALFAEIRAFIHRYVDVTTPFELAATSYALLSWLYDDVPELPYLRARGNFGSGKSRLLTTIGSICNKPIFASGASTVSPLFRMLDAIEGTLILDEADFRASDERSEIVKILNNGMSKGFPVLRSELNSQKEFNPRAFTVYGPKIIATRHAFEDEALESRCLTEQMGRRDVRPDIPISLPESFHEEARHLRNQLLAFRLQDAGQPREPLLLTGVSPRRAQVLSPLLQVTPSVYRAELEAALRALSGAFGGGVRPRRETSILQAVLTLYRGGESLSVGRIAEEASEAHGDTLSPRQVGHLLRSRLGLLPERRGGIYCLPDVAPEQLKHLALAYGLKQDVRDVEDFAEALVTEPQARNDGEAS